MPALTLAVAVGCSYLYTHGNWFYATFINLRTSTEAWIVKSVGYNYLGIGMNYLGVGMIGYIHIKINEVC